MVLREVEPEDLDVFVRHQMDPEANAMAAFPARDRATFLHHWTGGRGDVDVVRRTILSGGEVAGYVVCFVREKRRLVGYWIGREFWGRGIASRALAEFLEQVRVRPLDAFVAKHNLASIRVLEKCGFERSGEGVVPGLPPGEDGMVVEEWLYSLAAGSG